MIGAIIGAGLSAIGSIVGSQAAKKKRQQATRALMQEQAENKSWYNQQMYQDPTKRASARYLLDKTAEAIRERNRQARGMQAVMGSTEDGTIATKEANAKALADASAQVANSAEARQERAETQYQQRNANLNAQGRQMLEDSAQQTAQATNALVQTGANIASAIDSVSDNKAPKASESTSEAPKVEPIIDERIKQEVLTGKTVYDDYTKGATWDNLEAMKKKGF